MGTPFLSLLLPLLCPGESECEIRQEGRHVVKVGAYVLSIGQLDLTTGSYTVDLYLTFEGSPEDLEKLDFEFMNGRGGRELIKKSAGRVEYRVLANLYEQIDFRRFPFDTQTLSIQLEDKKLGTGDLVLVPNSQDSGTDPRIVLTGWGISQWDQTVTSQKYPGDEESFHRYFLKIRLKRQGYSSVVKIFLPLGCFVLVSFITLLLRPTTMIEGRVATNVGMLIATVMFHVGVMSTLPAMAYLTLTDHVFIASYLTIGFNLLQSVRMLRAFVNEQKDRAMAIYRSTIGLMSLVAAVAYPVAVLTNLLG